MKTNVKKENGQVLILLALALVGLLAFTGLAIDGSLVYTERRLAQNAADAAALGGANAAATYMEQHNILKDEGYWVCPQALIDSANSASSDSASENDYLAIEQGNVDTGYGVKSSCDNGKKQVVVQVVITDVTETNFIQLAFPSIVANTVEAVAIAEPPATLSGGHAITSLSPTCGEKDGGVKISLSTGAAVTIVDGGIHSNSCLDIGGTSTTVTAGSIDYSSTNPDDYTHPGDPTISPTPVGSTPIVERFELEPPGCLPLGFYWDDDGSVKELEKDDPHISNDNNGPTEPDLILKPGHYKSFMQTGGDVFLQPGLYCFDGELRVQGDSFKGAGVTIYLIGGGLTMRDANNNEKLNDIVNVDISAPTEEDPINGGIKGMLIWMADDNKSVVDIAGNASSHYTGTIYAPDGGIEANGDSKTFSTLGVSMVGAYVKVTGGGTITIKYDSSTEFTVDGKISLIK